MQFNKFRSRYGILVTPEDKSINPVECNKKNRGHCECANTKDGFTTYTFMVSGQKRCFTVYHPFSRKNESLPVVITAQCYAKDQIGAKGYEMKWTSSARNEAAAKYGFARIAVSTPDRSWDINTPRINIFFCFKSFWIL